MEDKMPKVESVYTEDGRRAERRIVESDGKRVIELHVEEERPKHLAQRVVEEIKPVVVKREIETVGADGQVTDRRVEAIDPPEARMQVREHIAMAQPVQTNDCDCVATRDDIIAAIKAFAESNSYAFPQAPVEAAPVTMPTTTAVVQHQIADNVQASDSKKQMQLLMIVGSVIVAQVLFIGYLWYCWN